MRRSCQLLRGGQKLAPVLAAAGEGRGRAHLLLLRLYQGACEACIIDTWLCLLCLTLLLLLLLLLVMVVIVHRSTMRLCPSCVWCLGCTCCCCGGASAAT
jgi:hypothetical protein